MQGKVCLVTGATSGIGLVASRELARQGALVVLVGRDAARTAAAAAHIQDKTGSKAVTTLLADLSMQAQVCQLAEAFRQRHQRLDVLINNACAIWVKRHLTADGLEVWSAPLRSTT
jgi:NAD(P)-dependent dehydrogenase (short-subunit alcohol dehydrogenase family)